jgi:hypothetical protein
VESGRARHGVRPTITFGDFDAAARRGVLYDMVWRLERLPD